MLRAVAPGSVRICAASRALAPPAVPFMEEYVFECLRRARRSAREGGFARVRAEAALMLALLAAWRDVSAKRRRAFLVRAQRDLFPLLLSLLVHATARLGAAPPGALAAFGAAMAEDPPPALPGAAGVDGGYPAPDPREGQPMAGSLCYAGPVSYGRGGPGNTDGDPQVPAPCTVLLLECAALLDALAGAARAFPPPVEAQLLLVAVLELLSADGADAAKRAFCAPLRRRLRALSASRGAAPAADLNAALTRRWALGDDTAAVPAGALGTLEALAARGDASAAPRCLVAWLRAEAAGATAADAVVARASGAAEAYLAAVRASLAGPAGAAGLPALCLRSHLAGALAVTVVCTPAVARSPALEAFKRRLARSGGRLEAVETGAAAAFSHGALWERLAAGGAEAHWNACEGGGGPFAVVLDCRRGRLPPIDSVDAVAELRASVAPHLGLGLVPIDVPYAAAALWRPPVDGGDGADGGDGGDGAAAMGWGAAWAERARAAGEQVGPYVITRDMAGELAAALPRGADLAQWIVQRSTVHLRILEAAG